MRGWVSCWVAAGLMITGSRISLANAPGYTEGHAQGSAAAEKESVDLFGFGSLGATCVFGAPGCIGFTLAGFLMEEAPREMDAQWTTEYREGYKQGYSKRLKERRARAAMVGGAIGIIPSLIVMALIFVIWFGFLTSSSDSSTAATAPAGDAFRSLAPPSGFQVSF